MSGGSPYRRQHSQADRRRKLMPRRRHEAGPQFSPDGARIAFHSDRTGKLRNLGVRCCGFQSRSIDFLRRPPGRCSAVVAGWPANRVRGACERTLRYPRRQRRWGAAAARHERNVRRRRSELVEGWTMDLFRVQSHGAPRSVEGACRWRKRGSGHKARGVCRLRIERRSVRVPLERLRCGRTLENCRKRWRGSAGAGVSKSRVLGLLDSRGKRNLLREHRVRAAPLSTVSELCGARPDTCCHARQKTGPV